MLNKYVVSIILLILCSPGLAEDKQKDAKKDHSVIYDPLEDVNRVIYEFNQVVDIVLFHPIAEVYGEFVPSPIRTGIHNVVGHLGTPIILINDILQLDVEHTAETVARFIVNSTFGILGLFDVATEMGIVYHGEDFGLTLGSYGVDNGPYLVIPILGPSNFRDLIGKVADIFMDPINWIAYNNDWDGWLLARTGVEALDARTESRNLIASIEKSLDPYAQTRTLYTQNRDYLKSGDEEEIVDTSDLPGED